MVPTKTAPGMAPRSKSSAGPVVGICPACGALLGAGDDGDGCDEGVAEGAGEALGLLLDG